MKADVKASYELNISFHAGGNMLELMPKIVELFAIVFVFVALRSVL